MAKAKESMLGKMIAEKRVKKVTSIGKSTHTRVNSRNGKRNHKAYRGQGK